MSTNRISKKIFFKIADVDMEAIIEKCVKEAEILYIEGVDSL